MSDQNKMFEPRLIEEIRDAWDNVAADFDRFVTPLNIANGEEVLRFVDLRPGMQLLDVATGSGALSIPAARLGAQVVAVDISPSMVERLKARARKEGLSNLEGRVMDGQHLELEDDTFDISASQFGVVLFPDLPRGLSELVRVTRPGGGVLMVTGGPPSKIEFHGFFIGAIQAVIPGFTGFPTDPPPLFFQLQDPEKQRHELAKAGLKDIRVETTTGKLAFQSGKQMWDWVTSSNPIGAMLVANLTKEQKALAQQTLDDMLRQRSGGSGPAVLYNDKYIGMGTK